MSSVLGCFEGRLLAVTTASVGVDENGLDDGEVAISELWSVGSGTR
jgi:hypothetical protein